MFGKAAPAPTPALALALFACAATGASGQGYRRASERHEFVASPRMHEVMELAALPKELDWRAKDGKNYTTVTRNQHIPLYCGACYSFGATSALSDRIRIARGGVGREINIAMQVVLNCDTKDNGCSGGDATSVYHWIKQNSVPDETCQPYEARGHDTGNTCEPKDVCRTCDADGCRAAEKYEVYGIEEHSAVRGEFQMMAELQRGPIACAIATPESFVNWLGWDIYEDRNHSTDIDHIISVVGYGTDNGKDYWILRNSWGTYWGHYGWARVARGINNIMIEQDCAWATPSNAGKPTWRHVDLGPQKSGKEPPSAAFRGAAATELAEDIGARGSAEAPACRAPKNDWAAVGGEVVRGPRPHEEPEVVGSLPRAWDWRNASGRSYVSWNTNEHLPRGGCASCWAHAVSSALSDRIAVHRKGAWPQVGLSPQLLINCHGGGSCAGGDPAGAYAFIHKNGITDETCQNYQATDLSCTAPHVCRNCAPGGEHGLVWPGKCAAVEQPIVYFLSQYGAVRGAIPMKAEIYKRGPIGCGLEASHGFRSYTGGIYSEPRDAVVLNQHVGVTGWGLAAGSDGVPAGTEFWIGRNSWGTYWGEGGWFRIQMHEHNLGIESDCDWGVPDTAAPVPSTSLTSTADLSRTSGAPMSAVFPILAVTIMLVLGTATYAGVRTARRLRLAEDSAPYILVEE